MRGLTPAHIVITGAMGVGKTTVGRLLAEKLDMEFLDSDELLEARTGESGSEIAVRDGVGKLHALELEVFLDACRSSPNAVIASAASVVDHQTGCDALVDNLTVWLTAPSHVLAERRAVDSHRREIDSAEQQDLDGKRAPILKQVSSIIVDAATATPAEIVAELIKRLPG